MSSGSAGAFAGWLDALTGTGGSACEASGSDLARESIDSGWLFGNGRVGVEKEWRRVCLGEVCAGSARVAGAREFCSGTVASCSVGRFKDDWF